PVSIFMLIQPHQRQVIYGSFLESFYQQLSTTKTPKGLKITSPPVNRFHVFYLVKISNKIMYQIDIHGNIFSNNWHNSLLYRKQRLNFRITKRQLIRGSREFYYLSIIII